MESEGYTSGPAADDAMTVLGLIVMNPIYVTDDPIIERMDRLSGGVTIIRQGLETIITGMLPSGIIQSFTVWEGATRGPLFIDCDHETLYKEHLFAIARHISGDRLKPYPDQHGGMRRDGMMDMREYFGRQPRGDDPVRLVALNGRWKNYHRYYSDEAKRTCAFVLSEVAWLHDGWEMGRNTTGRSNRIYIHPRQIDHTKKILRHAQTKQQHY